MAQAIEIDLPKPAKAIDIGLPKPAKQTSTPSSSEGGVGGFFEDALFTGRLGISDTYRGVSQIAGEKGYDIPGAADLEKMREDEKRLNKILEENPWAGWTGYIGGLLLDPAGWIPWAAPANRLRQINKLRKLWDKTDKASQAKKLAIEATAAGSAGAAVGSLGYLDEEAVNPITGERLTRGDMALMGGAGAAVLGPAFQAAGKKWAKAPEYKTSMGFNPDRKTGGVYTKTEEVTPGGPGYKVWDALSRPGPTGAAYGGALGGYAGWNSPNLQDLAPEELAEYGLEARLTNLALGVLGGGVGGKYAINKIGPEKFVKGFNQTKDALFAKQRKAGEAFKLYEDEIMPTLAKLEKLTPEENVALYKSVTEKEPTLKKAHLEKIPSVTIERVTELEQLGNEIQRKVDKLGKELVDLGVLDRKIQAKNASNYLHRIFDKPDAAWKRFRTGGLKMVGDELNARGKVETVSRAKWQRMLDDMADENTAGGVGRTHIDAGSKFLDEQGNLVRKDDAMEWEEWDMTPKEKKRYDQEYRDYRLREDRYNIRREEWLNRQVGAGPAVGPRITNGEAYDRILKKEMARAISKKANKFAYLGDSTDAERAATKLTPEEEAFVVAKAEKAAGMPQSYRTKSAPSAPRLPDARIRRDWTPEERKYMGEITSAYDSFRATGQLLTNDVAAARFLSRMARDPQIARSEKTMAVRIGDDGVPVDLDVPLPADRKKYGKLAGMYVSKETAYDLGRMNGEVGVSRMKATPLGRRYSQLNGLWKGTKTIMNPNVHMNNFMSNIMHYDHGVTDMGAKKWLWLGKAMKAMAKKGSKGTVTIGGKKVSVDEMLDSARRDGVFGGGMMSELGQQEVAKLMRGEAPALESGSPYRLMNSSMSIADKAWRYAKSGAKKWLWDKPGALYQYEDNVFRFALYMAETDRLMSKGVGKGSAKSMAARKGKDWFVNYDDVPEALALMRELPIPFLSYMYGIIPKIAETAVKHPAKIAKWSGLLALVNEAGWQSSDIDYDDRRDIEHLMENQAPGFNSRWGIPGMGPTNIKISDDMNPFDEQGDMGFLDLSRAYAGGNIMGGKEGDAGNLQFLPEWLQMNFGAAGGIVAPLMGYDLYKGQNIPMFSDRLAAAVKQFIPNFPAGEIVNTLTGGMTEEITNAGILPETWAGNKIQRARSGEYSDTKDVHTLPTAWASMFGIKLRPIDYGKLEDRIYDRFDKKVRLYDEKITTLGSELAAGGISEEDYEKKVDDLLAKQEIVIRQLDKALDRLE